MDLFKFIKNLTLRSISSSESISTEAGMPRELPFSPLLLFVIGEPSLTVL